MWHPIERFVCALANLGRIAKLSQMFTKAMKASVTIFPVSGIEMCNIVYDT